MTEIIQFIVLIISIVIHEVAHGLVAYRFGDPTAKNLGRLSLNPIVHVDILGSILLPAFIVLSGSSMIIGWAKPVPVNPRHFFNPTRDMMWVALAGPLSNLTLAIIASVLIKIAIISFPNYWLLVVLKATIVINLILMIFNFIPIPPLDGSRVMYHLLPGDLAYKLQRLEPYGFVIVFALAYLGALSPILSFFFRPLATLLL